MCVREIRAHVIRVWEIRVCLCPVSVGCVNAERGCGGRGAVGAGTSRVCESSDGGPGTVLARLRRLAVRGSRAAAPREAMGARLCERTVRAELCAEAAAPQVCAEPGLSLPARGGVCPSRGLNRTGFSAILPAARSAPRQVCIRGTPRPAALLDRAALPHCPRRSLLELLLCQTGTSCWSIPTAPFS